MASITTAPADAASGQRDLLRMTKEPHIPKHWEDSSWEEKARENPLHAIMTSPQFRDKQLADLDGKPPKEFLAKGRSIYTMMVEPFLTDAEKRRQLLMFDYGCGAGRIINAVIEAGHKAIGADISQTMLDTCRKVVPGAENLLLVAGDGAVELADGACDVAYSFAVLQHIKSLAAHEKAVAEMARIVKPGGHLSIQVNCEDFADRSGEALGHTLNFEEFSVHFRTLDAGPLRAHEQNNWSGVYIGIDRLIAQLNGLGFHVTRVFNWREQKPRAIVVVARKAPGRNVIQPRPDPFASPSWPAYRALAKKYAKATIANAHYKKARKEAEENEPKS